MKSQLVKEGEVDQIEEIEKVDEDIKHGNENAGQEGDFGAEAMPKQITVTEEPENELIDSNRL